MLALVLDASRRVTAALGYRDFRLLWFGALTSSIGTWMQKVAQAWLIVTLTGTASAFFLGLDSFVGELPILLFILIGGVVADRYNRRRLMLMSQYIQMAAAFTLAVLVFTNVAHVWHILVLSAITGIAQAFGGPAYQSLIPLLVEKQHLPNAIALNSIQFNLARVIGPIVAGAALAAFGMVACFGLNGLSFLFVIAAILALRVVHAPERGTAGLRDQLKGGLQYVRGNPQLVTLTTVGFLTAFLGFPLYTMLPIIAKDVFQQDVRLYTNLMTCAGGGAVIGALVVAWIGKHRHMGLMLLTLQGLCGLSVIAFADWRARQRMAGDAAGFGADSAGNQRRATDYRRGDRADRQPWIARGMIARGDDAGQCRLSRARVRSRRDACVAAPGLQFAFRALASLSHDA